MNKTTTETILAGIGAIIGVIGLIIMLSTMNTIFEEVAKRYDSKLSPVCYNQSLLYDNYTNKCYELINNTVYIYNIIKINNEYYIEVVK